MNRTDSTHPTTAPGGPAATTSPMSTARPGLPAPSVAAVRPPAGSTELRALMGSLRLPPGVTEPPAEVLVPLLYDRGLGIHQVAALCRRGPLTTRRILVDAGVEIRRPGTKAPRPRKPPNAVELYETGATEP